MNNAPPITDYETALPDYLAPRLDARLASPVAGFDGYDRPFAQSLPSQPSPQYSPPHAFVANSGNAYRSASDTVASPLSLTPPTTVRAASAYKAPTGAQAHSTLRHSLSIDNPVRGISAPSQPPSTSSSSLWENSPQLDFTPSTSFRWFRYELDNDIRPHKSLCAFTAFDESVVAIGRLSETDTAMSVYALSQNELYPPFKTQNFKVSMSKLLIQESRKNAVPGSAALIGEDFPFWKTRWSALTTTGDSPSVRVGCSIAQISSSELLLFGGVNYENHESYSDVYVLDMNTLVWKKIEPKSDTAPWPSPRSYHSSIVYMPPPEVTFSCDDTTPHGFDTTTLLVFGGCECHDTGIPNTFLSDFWSFDLFTREWSVHSPSGVGPTGRCQASILLIDETLVIASGLNGTTILADFFSLDFHAMRWERLQLKSPLGLRTAVHGMNATYGPLPIVERNAFSTRIPVSVQSGASAADRQLCSKVRSILARGGFMIGDTIGFLHPENENPRPLPLFCIDLQNRDICSIRYHDAIVANLEDVHPRIAAGLNATPRQVVHNDAAVTLFNAEQCAFNIVYMTTDAVYTLSMNEALSQGVNLMDSGRIPWRFGMNNVETLDVDVQSDETLEGVSGVGTSDSPGTTTRKHSGAATPLWTRLMSQVRGESVIDPTLSPTETREDILDYSVAPQNLFMSAADRVPSPAPMYSPAQAAANRKRCAHCHHECDSNEMVGAFCHAMCAAMAARQLRAAQSAEGSYAHLAQPLPSWTHAHVLEWIKTFGDAFDPYVDTFKAARISGRELIHVDDAILRDELGVKSSLHRKTMLAEIAAGISVPFENTSAATPSTDEGAVSPSCAKLNAPSGGTSSMMIIRHSELNGIAQLGEGNFGTTYKATLPSMFNSGVVIKVPKGKSGIAEWSELQAFMNAPPHPNVLPLLGICPDWPSPHPNSICFVTLFMQNGSLKDILNDNVKCAHMLGKHPFDQTAEVQRSEPAFKEFINRSIDLFVQTARGLNHLHANRLIHRDISCRNILVGSRRDVYVSDFGLSRRVSGDGDGESTDDLKAYYKVHNPSDTMLPYRWMSPESMESFVFTRHSDVWSFGVVCWEILTRAKTVPYSQIQRINTVMVKVCGGALKLTLPPWTPPSLAALIHRCWELEPTDRPSMAEVITQLTTVRDEFNRV